MLQIPPTPLNSNYRSSVKSLQSPHDKDWDIYNTKELFARLFDSVGSWDTSKGNKELIFEFLRQMDLEGISLVQRTKYIYALRIVLRAINKDFTCFDVADLEEFRLELSKYKPKTQHSRWYDAIVCELGC